METKKKLKWGKVYTWFIIALIPILNLLWIWKVTRLMVEYQETERQG